MTDTDCHVAGSCFDKLSHSANMAGILTPTNKAAIVSTCNLAISGAEPSVYTAFSRKQQQNVLLKWRRRQTINSYFRHSNFSYQEGVRNRAELIWLKDSFMWFRFDVFVFRGLAIRKNM